MDAVQTIHFKVCIENIILQSAFCDNAVAPEFSLETHLETASQQHPLTRMTHSTFKQPMACMIRATFQTLMLLI